MLFEFFYCFSKKSDKIKKKKIGKFSEIYSDKKSEFLGFSYMIPILNIEIWEFRIVQSVSKSEKFEPESADIRISYPIYTPNYLPHAF